MSFLFFNISMASSILMAPEAPKVCPVVYLVEIK